MKLIKPNWYGFDHVKINEKFEGDLTFVNDFCVNGEYAPCAVYKAKKPNKKKGHKKYMLITKNGDSFIVRGMTSEEILKWRYQAAVHCLSCDAVVYSVNRHDFRSCSCGEVAIDGGKEYTKVSFKDKNNFNQVTVDLLTDDIL